MATAINITSGLKPMLFASVRAIGAMMIAVAALLMTDDNIMVMSMVSAIVKRGGDACVLWYSAWLIISVAPLLCKALPTGMSAASNTMSDQLI